MAKKRPFDEYSNVIISFKEALFEGVIIDSYFDSFIIKGNAPKNDWKLSILYVDQWGKEKHIEKYLSEVKLIEW